MDDRSRSSLNDFRYLNIDPSHEKVLGHIHAGTAQWNDDQRQPVSLSYYINKYGDKLIWIEILGRSMAGKDILPGDLVVVAPTQDYRFDMIVGVAVEGRTEPIVKLWTRRGLYSIRDGNERVKEKITEGAMILGPVVWHLRDMAARNGR